MRWFGFQQLGLSCYARYPRYPRSGLRVGSRQAGLFDLATQKVAYDSNIIVNKTIAAQQGNDKMTEFYRATLVRPDFMPVLDKWIAQYRAGGTPTSLYADTWTNKSATTGRPPTRQRRPPKPGLAAATVSGFGEAIPG